MDGFCKCYLNLVDIIRGQAWNRPTNGSNRFGISPFSSAATATLFCGRAASFAATGRCRRRPVPAVFERLVSPLGAAQRNPGTSLTGGNRPGEYLDMHLWTFERTKDDPPGVGEWKAHPATITDKRVFIVTSSGQSEYSFDRAALDRDGARMTGDGTRKIFYTDAGKLKWSPRPG
jgi:hypothetical protein